MNNWKLDYVKNIPEDTFQAEQITLLEFAIRAASPSPLLGVFLASTSSSLLFPGGMPLSSFIGCFVLGRYPLCNKGETEIHLH